MSTPVPASGLSILRSFARPHLGTLALGLVLALAGSAMSLATPLVTKWVLDSLGASGSLAGPIGALLALLVFGADSLLGVVALVIAFAMLATSLVSWCPIWRAFGLNTCRTGGRPSDMRQAANVRSG